jgi:hypothetical protein
VLTDAICRSGVGSEKGNKELQRLKIAFGEGLSSPTDQNSLKF